MNFTPEQIEFLCRVADKWFLSANSALDNNPQTPSKEVLEGSFNALKFILRHLINKLDDSVIVG